MTAQKPGMTLKSRRRTENLGIGATKSYTDHAGPKTKSSWFILRAQGLRYSLECAEVGWK